MGILESFQKATEGAQFNCVQKFSLNSEEFSKFLKSERKIRAQTSEVSDTVESKGNPQSNRKRARISHLSSNSNDFKFDSS